MLQTKPRPFTVADYMGLPEHGPRYQLIEGELYMAPAPNRHHQSISGRIEFALGKYLERHPIGEIYHAPFDVELTDINVYQPDIAFFSNARRAYLTEHGAEGAPDLVVEILSPKTAKLDIGTKREIYARTGVTELWIVEPETRMVKVYRLQKNAATPHVTLGEDKVLTTPLFPGLKIRLKKIFEL
jgi:Uma2 family endonuclease